MGTKKGEGLYPRIVKHYSKNAKTKKMLFTAENVMKNFNIDAKMANNALYWLHRTDDICRHKERKGKTGGKGRSGKYQYAIEIAEEFNDPYVASHASTNTSSGGRAPGLTAIQRQFALIHMANAKLEDMIIKALTEADEIKKQKHKLTAALRSIQRLE